VRSVMHGAAAAAAKARGLPAMNGFERIARSGQPVDEKMVETLLAGAAQVADNAPGAAPAALLRVLHLTGSERPRPAVVAHAVRLLSTAGRLAEARRLAETALQEPLDAPAEAAIRLGLAEALKHAGLNADVVQCTRRGLAMTGVSVALQAHLLAVQAHALFHVGDIEAAGVAGAEAARLGRSAGQPSATVFGLVAQSAAARGRAELGSALAHAQQAVEIADAAGGDARQRHPRLWLARTLAAVDRFDDADTIYTAGQHEADRIGSAWSQPLWQFYRAELRLAAGRLTDAQAEAEAGIRVAERLDAQQLSVPLSALLARVALLRDEMGEAREHLRRTQPLVADGVSVGPGDLTFALALLQLAAGQPKTAMDTVADVYRDQSRALLLLSTDPGAAATLVRIALRAGAPDMAGAVVAAALHLAQQNPSVASVTGAAVHAQGLLRANIGLLRMAVRQLRSGPRPLTLATALEDLAVAEHRAGHTAAAVRLLGEALRQWSACDARRDAGRVRRRLAQLSVKRRDRAEPGRRATVHETLTASELRVIRLVTQGLTNQEAAERLFLSPHTIDSHLRHAFTKLGVNSRVELTRLFLEHEAAARARAEPADHVKT
jgi:DNA-binding CsgD family transcriptional regulator